MLIDVLWMIIIVSLVFFVWIVNGIIPAFLGLFLKKQEKPRKKKYVNKLEKDSDENPSVEDGDNVEDGGESTSETDIQDEEG